MLRIKGDLNSPIESTSGNAQILQALFDEVNHFITTRNRLNKVRMGLDIGQKSVFVFRKLKEIALLFHSFYRTTAVRTNATGFFQLVLRPERLALHAIFTFVVLLVNVALLKNFLNNSLHYLLMTFLRSTYKVIIADFQHFP